MRGARSGYWSNVECEITAMQNLRVVEILDFEVKASTDGGCHEDVLIHGRDDFCGTVGPINVTMAAGDSMHWVALADYDGGGLDGWTLCATPADITEPTTPTEPTGTGTGTGTGAGNGPTEPTEPTTPTTPTKPNGYTASQYDAIVDWLTQSLEMIRRLRGDRLRGSLVPRASP